MQTNTKPPDNLSHVIYQYLWHEIASLHLVPGEKLSEAKLAKKFNCSRIPVREAIRLMVPVDALEVQSQRGSFVTLIDLQQLERIRYIREALEMKVILDGYHAGCFESITSYLESMVIRQEELIAANAYEIAFQIDIEFHKILYNLADKGFVQGYTGEKDIHYLRARLLAIRLENLNDMPNQHRAIVAAIKNHDENALQNATYAHLRNVSTVLSSGYNEFESYFKR